MKKLIVVILMLFATTAYATGRHHRWVSHDEAADTVAALSAVDDGLQGQIDALGSSSAAADARTQTEISRLNSAIKKEHRYTERNIAINAALSSVELDPGYNGFSVGTGLGISDNRHNAYLGGAIGVMYGKDNKAFHIKYGQSGSYTQASAGITVGF
jgi:hypothetical protein